MTQTRIGSLIEVVFNTLIGLFVAFASQLIVFPLVGLHGIPLSTNFEISAYFTVISVARSYIVRRWFNARLKRASESLASRVSTHSQQNH